MRSWRRRMAALLAMATVCTAQALQVTDDRGTTLNFAAPPRRIVSLLPSLTEAVCELGQCQLLVGVDRYSNHPTEVTRLPKVGGGLDPQIEAIVTLRPDVVLMATSSRAADRLEGLGIKVLALDPKSHTDVQRVVLKLGQLLDVADAQRVWRAIDAGVSAAAQSITPSIGRTRVYFEVSRGPFAAGESSFIGETLTRLGVQNIVPARLGPFPRLNPEYIARANPDLIMIGQRSVEGMADRPGWQRVRALREQRVCVFSNEQFDVLIRPGPRMPEAARLMARCLNDKGRPQTRHSAGQPTLAAVGDGMRP